MLIEKSSSLPAEDESASTSSTVEQMWESLNSSRSYRKAFVEEVIASRITAQIHELRIKHGWDYKQFAKKLGKKLSWAYRLEDPTQPPPTIPSLLDVADTYDVALDVRLIPFSSAIKDVTRLNGTSFAVPAFDEEFRTRSERNATAYTQGQINNRPTNENVIGAPVPIESWRGRLTGEWRVAEIWKAAIAPASFGESPHEQTFRPESETGATIASLGQPPAGTATIRADWPAHNHKSDAIASTSFRRKRVLDGRTGRIRGR